MDKSVTQRIHELELEIKQLQASLPAHSVPASMLIRLEDLEDELATLKSREEAQKG